MTTWIRTDEGLSATINFRSYLIKKHNTYYILWSDGQVVGDGYATIAGAKADTEAHAATPDTTKPGSHIDAIAGQQLVDILKRSFTTARIQDFMDASPYDEPDTGAPEPQS